MRKVITVELMKGKESLGHAPVIQEGGRNIMVVEDDEPVTFDTAKEAKQYGKDFKLDGTCQA